MGFFSANDSRPGPGVSKEAKPKRGMARWWEILARDYPALLRANLCFLVCCAPSAACAAASLWLNRLWLLAPAVALTAAAGPAWAAVNRLCMQAVRDVPFFTWYHFKKAYRENLRQGAAGGVLAAAAAALLAYAALASVGRQGFALPVLCCLALAAYMASGAALFLFMQMPMVELPFGGLLRNSVLLIFAGGWRSAAAILTPLVVGGLSVYFVSFALPVLLLGGPAVLCMTSCLIFLPRFRALFLQEEAAAQGQAGGAPATSEKRE